MKRATRNQKLPAEVGEKLGPYYVYMLIDPRDKKPFYIGKGQGGRLLSYGFEADVLSEEKDQPEKIERVFEIRASGFEPSVEVLRHGIDSNGEALRIEASLIDAMEGILCLTNRVRGQGIAKGRAPLNELLSVYGAKKLSTNIPAILIIQSDWIEKSEELEPGHKRAGHGWKKGMSSKDLYDATRGWWRVDQKRIKRCKIKYAVSVRNGITREVYEIEAWFSRSDKRWCFSGKPVTFGPIWENLVGPLGKKVPQNRGAQFPTKYWPLD